MSADLQRRLALEGYPRWANYDPEWVLENLMGPNVLWLTEGLTQRMELAPGMRVLDLGCGKALVSLDAYHYFGTDDLYLSFCARFLRPGGWLGIVCPGIREEFTGGPPAHLQPYWDPDFWSFHSPAWWRERWERTRLVRVETADMLLDGWRQWLTWLEICAELGYPAPPSEMEMLRVDAGRTLGFTRVVATKSST